MENIPVKFQNDSYIPKRVHTDYVNVELVQDFDV